MSQRRTHDEDRDETPAVPVGRPAAVAPTVAAVLRAQHHAGNRAVTRVLATEPARLLARLVTEEKVGAETVKVQDAAETKEADRIIKKLKDTYGISVDSSTAMQAVKAGYPHAPKTETDKLAVRPWQIWELVAIEKAADAFAPILGKARATSTRASASQEVTNLGKLNNSITVNTDKGVIDTNTTGEYFRGSQSLSLFEGAEKWGGYFGNDYKQQRIQTAAHEMAHGLLEYALPGFILATGDGKDPETGYWKNRSTKTGLAGAEAPPTGYGSTNAAEDMSEAFGIYVADKDRLKNGDGTAKPGEPGNPCPKRYAYCEKVIAGWTPPPPTPKTP
jgi:hypothetical protein